MRLQSWTPSPTASASACGAHSPGQDRTCSPPRTTTAPRSRYQRASAKARTANVRCTVMPTTCGNGSAGGGGGRGGGAGGGGPDAWEKRGNLVLRNGGGGVGGGGVWGFFF